MPPRPPHTFFWWFFPWVPIISSLDSVIIHEGSGRTLWKPLELSSCAASSYWALCPTDSSCRGPSESHSCLPSLPGHSGPRWGFSSCAVAGAPGPCQGLLPAVQTVDSCFPHSPVFDLLSTEQYIWFLSLRHDRSRNSVLQTLVLGGISELALQCGTCLFTLLMPPFV